MKLFVPGRICIFGEHSDWAGGYRRTNADIGKGFAIISGTNQGIHAEVEPHPSKFIFDACLEDGTRLPSFEVPMEAQALLAAANDGEFYSYAAGVAYQVLTHYQVRGLHIVNEKTTLPVKKGLSSSAAVCVLVARAFNRIYDLKLTTRGEMELAYFGEITTPSRCGRLDQGCAYGDRPVIMTFDGDRLDVREISVPRDLHFVLVDLQASKDTREILNRLNHCYPFAENETATNVQAYLGPINESLVKEAEEAFRIGDARRIGRLMSTAQDEFDRCLQPACPSQLTAPVLHEVLNYAPLKPFIYGGKGVGSQGDGTAQFIARDKESQRKLIELIERDLKMPCLSLSLNSARRVRKAVIPAAGFGTRMFPATKAVKKELFPIIDNDGRAKPAILLIVEEAINAGIEEVCILVQTQDRDLFEEVFCTPPPIENFNKLSSEQQEYCKHLTEIGNRITFLTQDTQEGFGHAVNCASEWVGNEPFLLMLGDHIYQSNTERCCAQQLVDVYEQCGHSVVGVMETPGDVVHQFGCIAGEWHTPEHTALDIKAFAEKPTIEYAEEHLRIDGVPEDTYLTVFGQYVLSPKVFEFLQQNIDTNFRERGEFQLTSCLDRVRIEEGFTACAVDGRRFDIGNPEAYLQTLVEFARTGAVAQP
jgi:UTP-glucose-1-phosphate uridylyltransferase/mevalonate kinase